MNACMHGWMDNQTDFQDKVEHKESIDERCCRSIWLQDYVTPFPRV